MSTKLQRIELRTTYKFMSLDQRVGKMETVLSVPLTSTDDTTDLRKSAESSLVHVLISYNRDPSSSSDFTRPSSSSSNGIWKGAGATDTLEHLKDVIANKVASNAFSATTYLKHPVSLFLPFIGSYPSTFGDNQARCEYTILTSWQAKLSDSDMLNRTEKILTSSGIGNATEAHNRSLVVYANHLLWVSLIDAWWRRLHG